MYVIKSGDQVLGSATFGRQKKFVHDPQLWKAHLFKTHKQALDHIQANLAACQSDLVLMQAQRDQYDDSDAYLTHVMSAMQEQLVMWNTAQVVKVQLVEAPP